MKKSLIGLFLSLVLVMGLSVSSFAGSTAASGTTTGGTSGILNTFASLTCGASAATATTSAGSSTNVTLSTTVNITFLNAVNHYQTNGASGSGSATAYSSTGQGGVSASSSHRVNGGKYWGSWSKNLSTSY